MPTSVFFASMPLTFKFDIEVSLFFSLYKFNTYSDLPIPFWAVTVITILLLPVLSDTNPSPDTVA